MCWAAVVLMGVCLGKHSDHFLHLAFLLAAIGIPVMWIGSFGRDDDREQVRR